MSAPTTPGAGFRSRNMGSKMKISNDKLVELSKQLFDERHRVLEEKGRAYSTTTDRLKNFDEAAGMLRMQPEEVWAVYAHKHWSSLVSYCHDPHAPISEGIDSRIVDMMNYLDLLYAMVQRRKAISANVPL